MEILCGNGGDFLASKIIYVEPDSLAEDAGIEAGDVLLKVSGHEIHDILEYRYLMSEYEVTVTIEKRNGDIDAGPHNTYG